MWTKSSIPKLTKLTLKSLQMFIKLNEKYYIYYYFIYFFLKVYNSKWIFSLEIQKRLFYISNYEFPDHLKAWRGQIL